jgi:hypothetical protein
VYGRKQPGAFSSRVGGQGLILIFLVPDVPRALPATNKTTPVGAGRRTNRSVRSTREAISTPVRARRASLPDPSCTPPLRSYLMGDNQRALSLSLAQSSARTRIRKRKPEPPVLRTRPVEEQENERPVREENKTPISYVLSLFRLHILNTYLFSHCRICARLWFEHKSRCSNCGSVFWALWA